MMGGSIPKRPLKTVVHGSRKPFGKGGTVSPTKDPEFYRVPHAREAKPVLSDRAKALRILLGALIFLLLIGGSVYLVLR